MTNTVTNKTTDIQAIFFDIDDTLSRDGILHPNSTEVLQRLRNETLLKIIIATGRGSVMLPDDIHQLAQDNIVDAIITTNGQYNLVGDTVLSQSAHHIAWSEPVPQYDMIAKLFAEYCVIEPDYYQNHNIYQFSVFLTEEEEEAHKEYVDKFKELGFHLTRWRHGGADIIPIGASKVCGIQDVCQHFNIDIHNAMAFGDGLNDIEMLQSVGIGVAMGNEALQHYNILT